ncbi:MAG: transporter [Planctomycetota bacterium]|nr:transporter [Planctomycetota bacterium]
MVTDAAKLVRLILAMFCGLAGIARGQDLSNALRADQNDEAAVVLPHAIDDRDLGNLFQWSRNPSYSGGPDLDEPLVSDRPDFTEASSTVGRGVSQFEVGYTYTYDVDGGRRVRSQSMGEPLLRRGMFADWFELRLGLFPINERVRDGVSSRTTVGTEDLYLGAKLGITPQDGVLPEMALIPQMTVPTGSDDFSAGEVLPGALWAYSWELESGCELSANTQMNRAIDEVSARTYWELAQSVAIGFDLVGRFGGYTEWYAMFPSSSESARVEHYFNGGITYLCHKDLQLDFRAGTGLSESSDDFFLGIGFVARFP